MIVSGQPSFSVRTREAYLGRGIMIEYVSSQSMPKKLFLITETALARVPSVAPKHLQLPLAVIDTIGRTQRQLRARHSTGAPEEPRWTAGHR